MEAMAIQTQHPVTEEPPGGTHLAEAALGTGQSASASAPPPVAILLRSYGTTIVATGGAVLAGGNPSRWRRAHGNLVICSICSEAIQPGTVMVCTDCDKVIGQRLHRASTPAEDGSQEPFAVEAPKEKSAWSDNVGHPGWFSRIPAFTFLFFSNSVLSDGGVDACKTTPPCNGVPR